MDSLSSFSLSTDSSLDGFSFLQDDQDKNPHLYPSSDIAFELNLSSSSLCGKREYDSFRNWEDDLLDVQEASETTNQDIFSFEQESSSCVQITTETNKKSSSVQPEKKKRKFSSELSEEEMNLLLEDSRSSSPHLNCLSESQSSFARPASPIAPKKVQSPPVLKELMSVIENNIDDSVRESLFSSFSRLAERADAGKPLNPPQHSLNPLQKIEASQDYLAMQTAFHVSVPPVIKPESVYLPIRGQVPFVVNNPYMFPVRRSPNGTLVPYQPVPRRTTTVYPTSTCTKNFIYPAQQQFMSQPQVYSVNMQPQKIFAHSQTVHVL